VTRDQIEFNIVILSPCFPVVVLHPVISSDKNYPSYSDGTNEDIFIKVILLFMYLVIIFIFYPC